MTSRTASVLAALIVACCHPELGWTQDIEHEYDSMMMNATLKIGSGASLGSAFLVEATKAPERTYALVSAAHVFEKMPYSNATIYARQRLTAHTYRRHPFEIRVRDTNGAALWVRHKTEDVAAMWVTMPPETYSAILDPKLLATEKVFQDYRIHPGDQVRVLGFPLGVEGSESAHPVLRMGHISSFPLVPIQEVKRFLIDMPVLPGNSGGPAYMLERRYTEPGSVNSVTIFSLVGVVTDEMVISQPYSSLTDQGVRTFRLNLAQVVHMDFVREVIKSLPR